MNSRCCPTRWRDYPKPTVEMCPCNCKLWRATVTKGFYGNYETYTYLARTWREAFDWAYSQVKDWRK